MNKKAIYGTLATVLMIVTGTLSGWALHANRFATDSRLATGKWVKVAVAEDGIYQLTAEQLADMGFSDISRVQIYGHGGHPITETFKGYAPDDLQPAPMMVHGDKIVFYARGVVKKELDLFYPEMPYYVRTRNAYANYGYYFVGETDSPTAIAQQQADGTGTTPVAESLDSYIHERELASGGFTGKQLLGEEIYPAPLSLDFSLPQRADPNITVSLVVGGMVKNSYNNFIQASVTSNGTTADAAFDKDEATLLPVTSDDVQRHYRTTYPVGIANLGHTQPDGTLSVSMTSQGTVSMARLDYATITYKRHNSYDSEHDYFNMGFASLEADNLVVMPGTDSQTVVWDITEPGNERNMQITSTDGGMAFTPGERTVPCEFIAFNPNGTLRAIESYEDVSNQNLHNLSVPDMLIVTHAHFMGEAERLAQLHRDHDGMTVHVVDQEQVFNEFSSGTPDAMAIRLMCKMLYDRDNKFKHLLMFGPATYDYRGLTVDKPYRVITYQSDASETDATSYGTDDFFGFLADNATTYYANETLMLGVGRMTPTNLDQARMNVDKVIHYVLNPDFGPWRNHYTIWADTGDNDLHAIQAEGIDNKIQQTLGLPMVVDKAYVDLFPTENNGTSAEARRHIIEMLNRGQFYGTYVGHAGTKQFTKSRMWTLMDVQGQSYDHQPIFMTACCDVARFDGNSQGIAEVMFQQPNGGAIALLTSSREVEAKQNDNLNQAFTEALFSYKNTGRMTTLGEAYMNAKRSSYVRYNINKLSYLLLGDPAMQVHYPTPHFKVTTINGQDANSAVFLSPLQQVEVQAQVLKPGTQQVDTEFNGEATLSIYDNKKLLRHAVYNPGSSNPLANDIYYPRDLLAEVRGRVVNGLFTGSVVLPRYIKAQPGETLAVHVYAHRENTTDMVNGVAQAYAKAYDETVAIDDNNAPVIGAMFLNDQESFDQGVPATPNSVLHIVATDDMAFNMQSMSIGNSMKLTLDGGKTTYTLVNNYAAATDGGRQLTVNFPINGLSEGRHSLTFYVQDACGNGTERTINFLVGSRSQMTIKTDDLVATQELQIELENTSLPSAPPVKLRVVDNRGNVVWHTTSSTLPYTWDLTGSDGQRVKAGLYYLSGIYHDGTRLLGTNVSTVIVMDPVHRTN